jgi:phosphatidylglycerophosphatase A
LDIDWVNNFISCTKYQDYDPKSYRYDEIIGPWFNFIQTSSLFGWIGAVFGIS